MNNGIIPRQKKNDAMKEVEEVQEEQKTQEVKEETVVEEKKE